jgi:hypothetical protein
MRNGHEKSWLTTKDWNCDSYANAFFTAQRFLFVLAPRNFADQAL